uniref:Toxin Ts4 n=1 Tax=Tityus serrulatus TaxID=6887 RepID=SCX4_TITSE|nr:RecName: Full=Toxin Ts4; AltName: Full=Non-toxic protein TsNTxP; Short=NTxP; AltName: Full=P-Allerg-alpha* NaTx4.1; AltName: Full=PT-Immun-alpha* NaTx4.2; AltName: Full=Tityustoxin VI; Short=Ts VI; Short=TsTX-VI; Short=TsTXVI; Short=TsVI; AltName: Full=Tityustoxin-6; Short=Ts-6; Flags: Precursor [Tityus serrulatus]AAC25688.1 immunogenic venom protein TsnTxp [Tityus serrulatus]AAC25689.1 immunogenic protein NTxp [Tityus serrulatus]QPD99044.1 sodium channel toxin Ts4 [Tityus serrulatus]
MKRMILFISCLLLIDIVVGGREGYPADSKGCKITCFLTAAGYCNTECTLKKGSSGYCAWPACYCYGLPDSVKIWTSETNKCGKK